MNKNKNVSRLAVQAMIVALYVVLTLGFKPISFNSIQFRLAEVLNLMAFINPVYGVAVTLGCFVSNMFSELGPIDMVFGTISTALAVFFISKSKNLLLASIWPTIFSGIIVGIELTYVFATPLWFNIVTVSIGQFAVVTLMGYPLFKYILKNKVLLRLIGGEAIDNN